MYTPTLSKDSVGVSIIVVVIKSCLHYTVISANGTGGCGMQLIRCPKCKQEIILNEAQVNLLRSNGQLLCSCPACKYLFNYTYQNSYKRPFKFTVLAALGRGTFLKNGDLILNHSEYHYNALQHTVSKRVVVPSGPQGYVEVAIPQKIKTHEELSEYLDNYSLWGKDNQGQTDDVYISVSELSKCEDSSNFYKYMDWFVVLTTDNKLLTCITEDSGYEPMLIYRDFLVDELNFTLENEYGLTNMVGKFTYQGNSFILEYDVECNSVFFSVDIKDEKIPKCFFETISYLEKLDAEKYKS